MAQIQDRTTSVVVAPLRERARRSRGRKLWGRVRYQYGLLVGGTILLLVVLVTLLAPLLAPYDPIDLVEGRLHRRLGHRMEVIVDPDRFPWTGVGRLGYGRHRFELLD